MAKPIVLIHGAWLTPRSWATFSAVSGMLTVEPSASINQTSCLPSPACRRQSASRQAKQ